MIKKILKRFKEKYCTLEMLKLVFTIGYFISSLVNIVLPINLYFKLALQAILFFAFSAISLVIKEAKEDRDRIPTVSKRFTKKAENGQIIIDEKRYRQAILYLYEVEDKLYK